MPGSSGRHGRNSHEEKAQLTPRLTAARVTHPGTKETREFRLETPQQFTEIDQFGTYKAEEATAREASNKAAFLLTHKEIRNDGRFSAYNEGIVIDMRTNLMWAADTGSEHNWFNAISYCTSYRGSGFTDWRLPTKEELESIVDKTQSNPAVNTAFFPNTKSSGYWSSTTCSGDMTDAWGVGFVLGNTNSYNKSSTLYVRCAR